MTRVEDRFQNETIQGAVRALLSEVNDELTYLDPRRKDFRTRLERIKRLMIAPAPLIAAADRSRAPLPVVSIVLPTRNRAPFVGEAIASVQAQSYPNWELIIVDDGSTDNTADVVAAFLQDPRIRYVAQAFSGQPAARNHGLRLARSSLIAHIDSDNLWYPHFLSAAVMVLVSFHDVDCVYGALVTEAHVGCPKTILFEDFAWQRLLRGNYIDINTVVHRKSLTDAYGGFDEALTRLTDWDLLLRLTKDKPAQRVPVLAAHYRVVDDQRVSATHPFEPNCDAIKRKWSHAV